MIYHLRKIAVGLVLLLFVPQLAHSQDSAVKPAKPAAPLSISDYLQQIDKMAVAANDARHAAEAMERFGNAFDENVGSVAKSLAMMSSEFDPFGFKTGFRVIGQQTEIIQQQSETIRELQQREIDRLRSENKKLKKRRTKSQQSKSRNRKSKP
ncbi:MAG: hypothetical protein COA78_02890 [Blastopirellula sp.]|nr:MAG: hypothetical protein COA78_02890 [Blastopirellula sp.]